jgi:ribosomal-protein-alanine N-acetyltransferase
MGRCGLLPWKIEERQEVEVAFLLGKKFWGQGFATEAALAIVRYAFGQLDLSRLICLIDPENMASVNVAQRIGMRFEQRVDGIDGDGFPTLIYAISRNP